MPSKSSKANALTAEEQKAKMAEERDFITKLMEAALEGDGSKVQQFISQYSSEHDSSPAEVLRDFRDGNNRTVLHFACSSPPKKEVEKDIVSYLLNKSFLPLSAMKSLLSLEDDDGFTPLMLACHNKHGHSLGRIKHLVDIGGPATLSSRSKAGAMPLHYASGSGASRDIIMFLYENGKESLNLLSSKVGSPLHWASGVDSSNDYSETIDALLQDCGVDVNILNEKGISSLLLAAASGNDTHAKKLVENGADRGFILGGNMTVYHIAADLNLFGTLEALLKVDVTDADKKMTTKCLQMKSDKGATPLDLSALANNVKCVMLLSDITDEKEATAFVKQSKIEWEEKEKILKKEENSKCSQEDEDVHDDDSPQKIALSILANASTITEESKIKASDLKTKGNQHYSSKKWEEAITFYTEAIELNPADATYYSNRSACYMALQKYDEALFDALITRTLKPDWVKGCFRVTIALLAMERYEDAALSAFEGMSIDQDNEELDALFKKCIKKARKEHAQKGNNDSSNSKGNSSKTLKKVTVLER